MRHPKQAIRCRYIGPTNTKGSRIKAECYGGSITVAWDHERDTDANMIKACDALIEKLGWKDSIHAAGVLKDGSYVFVEVSK